MLYRIYTEDMNRAQTEALVSRYFDGFTLTEGTGYWKGEAEASLIIEVVGNEDLRETVMDCAAAIKKANEQESVLVQAIENSQWFI